MDNPSDPSRTPQRGRSAYPAHLARAGDGPRVPLHRRGTSQKLECLEDLLREAGFKETRVFTPETERIVVAAEGRRKQSDKSRGKDRTGAGPNDSCGLFGLLTSLVSKGHKDTFSRHGKTQSWGRSAGKQSLIYLNDEADEWPRTIDEHRGMLTPTPNCRRPITPVILAPNLSSSGSSSTSFRSPPQLRDRSVTHVPTNKTANGLHLDARSRLRHMISMPEFAILSQTSRPNFARHTTVVSHTLRKQHTARLRESGRTSVEGDGPLPQKWLSTVTQSIFGIPRAGSPFHHTGPLSDKDNHASTEYVNRDGNPARRGFAPSTPRAAISPGIVTPASVVCYSAPSSRSSSLLRNKCRKRHIRNCEPCMPLLGATIVQLPGPPNSGPEIESNGTYNRNGVVLASTDDGYDESSEDEGELDFARLILPPRRQHSIQSLRRHLHNHAKASVAIGGVSVPPSAFNRVPKRSESRTSVRTGNKFQSRAHRFDDPDDMLHSRYVSSDEDAEDEFRAEWAAHDLPGLRNATRKKRAALPWTSRMPGS